MVMGKLEKNLNIIYLTVLLAACFLCFATIWEPGLRPSAFGLSLATFLVGGLIKILKMPIHSLWWLWGVNAWFWYMAMM